MPRSEYYKHNEIMVMGRKSYAVTTKLLVSKAGTGRKYDQYRITLPAEVGSKIKNRKLIVIVIDEEAINPDVVTPEMPQYDLITALFMNKTNLVPEEAGE